MATLCHIVDQDEERIREEMKDLINDEIEEEDESGDESESGKRKHEDDSEIDDQLDDDDLDLIQENLGIRIKKTKKLKRIRMMSDDEESDKEEEKDRNAIAEELFEHGEGEEGEEMEEASERPETTEYQDLEESEDEDDMDNFIVNEDGEPVKKAKKKRHIIHTDAALQEAQDIFGVDFDFEEFDEYAEGEEEEEEEFEEDEYMEEEGEDGVARPRTKKVGRKKGKKKGIFDVYEPTELERGFFTDKDQEIRTKDMPERFQLRQIAVRPLEDGELEEEAEWIYKQAFTTPTMSQQNLLEQESHGNFGRRPPSMVNKIREAINFMRDQHLEVPFIAFYRKEYVESDLNINDLWKIWQFDEKWTQLRTRKTNMVRLFEKMQNYQFEENADPEKVLESNVRALTEEDIDRIKQVQTIEELRDVYQHFVLYYGPDIPKMRNAEKTKARNEENSEHPENEDPPEQQEMIKQASRKSGYTICQQNKLDDIAQKFGLSPEQFGENLRDNYQRHDVEQYPLEPLEVAKELVCSQFPTDEEVLLGARHMVAMQICHDPLVRQCVRQTYFERAKINVVPSKKGIKEIDEAHPCYAMKYLKNKPVKDLKDEMFIKLSQGEEDGLLTITIFIDDMAEGSQTYFEEVRQLFYRDEFSHLVQQWNLQRSQALERALTKLLYPQMEKELRAKLIAEAKEGILKACCRKLYNWLKVAPYQADQQLEDDYDDDEKEVLRVLGLSFITARDTPGFGALIDGEGQVTDFIRMPYLTKRRNAWRQVDKDGKAQDLEKIKDFIATKKPHVVAVSAESRKLDGQDVSTHGSDCGRKLDGQDVSTQGSECCRKLDGQDVRKQGLNIEFRDYPVVLRHAVSIARRLQDPLIEFAQLCNVDEDILCLKYHPMQDQIPKDDLLNALSLEFVNRVNEVGVDINRAIANSHTAPLVQFVCGLGPRKASQLLKILKQANIRLENRTQLVEVCHMGPNVFINCAGFIKIDTSSLGDSTDAYIEVLDGSRVHPENYEWARKMAVDALEYDDTAEDANPAGALEEILESPERLKDLDLDAFAEELERQGYGDKHITLYDIRAELNHRYKDLRTPYRSPLNEERFNMITKETPETFYVGKLILTTVAGIAHRRPRGDQLDQANPVRDQETGLWKCPFCNKDDFPELSEVWSHFDAGSCPGSAVGVRTRLDNGVTGFIHTKNISDKMVKNPEDRVKVGMTIHSRITKIDIDRFQVDLTCKSSDLMDKDGNWKPPKDLYYDQDLEKESAEKEEEKRKQQARQTYTKRVIAHPSFHNIGYKECEKLLSDMDQGEAIIRPSSKGSDHLTVTWKVGEGAMQHIDVKERGKENAFSLGTTLVIGNEEFEDLDEILARHIQPMAALARDIMNFKYHKEFESGKRETLDKILLEEKKKGPSRIPYYLSLSKQYPGKYTISYMPRTKARHEFITLLPDGLRYRQQTFHSLNSLIRWFKEHFRDPIPGTPASARTPMVSSNYATPSINLQGVDAATIQRAAAGLPSNIYNTLAQVAGAATPRIPRTTPGATPQFGSALHGAGFNIPLGTTPLMTPMMTPQHHITTPQVLNTPSYQPTPRAAVTPVWPGATPRATPRSMGTPSHPSQQSQRPAPSSTQEWAKPGTDWAKAAAMWAKGRQKPSTPRSGQSPAVRASPMEQGDSTPLIDER
ncbi:Transcription elongation factor SPT6 [Mizuhopecten yessoensis]|uniref:Transcription elongation factor SPT6 n=1 Tax=Mizuhopecten yessoensis TaxID=6573 RepID=A0A210Q1C0_MIZYE|nr:Transcription elongation factor SPT6 [Mizuhopecten yessoensis]